MKADQIILNSGSDRILINTPDSTHGFDLCNSLKLETGLNQNQGFIYVILNGFEFTIGISRQSLYSMNKILAAYNSFNHVKETRLSVSPNWKFEFEKMGYRHEQK